MKDKKVTNLLLNISKARDILDSGDVSKVFNNHYFFEKLKNDIIRQIIKYIKFETHETDFNHEDVRAISDGLFDIADKMIKMRYSNLHKILTKNKPIEMEHYTDLCNRVANSLYFSKYYRNIAEELSHFALTLWLWSESEYKKDFFAQIEDHIRSFI